MDIEPLKIHAIIHGRSSKRGQIIRSLEHFTDDGIVISHSLTDYSFHAEEIAHSIEADVILSCGGDGTNHEIVNGILRRPVDDQPKLAFIPAGSGNDFVRSLTKRTIPDLLDQIRTHSEKACDVIAIDIQDAKKYALNMCTSGISGRIAQTANLRKKYLPTGISYYSAIIEWLFKYQSPELKIEIGSKSKEGEFFLVACANGSYAGNGLGLSPQSTPFNNTMGLTTIGPVSVLDFLRYQSTLKKGKMIKDHRVNYESHNSVRITVQSGELAVEADGESIAILSTGQSIELTILPQALKIFA